ncbi:flavin reductase family protein [Agrobacterium vitis]|nr:flavin reductase family protein [Agrobacterium vitis]
MKEIIMKDQEQTQLDPLTLRNAFGYFPSGVTALCALIEGKPAGMAVASFTTVSLDPPLVSVCIQNNSSTWPVLKTAERLGLSVLGSEQHGICSSLAAKGIDRFRDISWETSRAGAIFVSDAAMVIECSIHETIEAGDHQIILLRLHLFSINPHVEPLVFHRSTFRRLDTSLN